MFQLRPVMKQGDNFDSILMKNGSSIGNVGKDEKGIYINLTSKLSLHENLELLKVVNGLREDYYQLKVDIQYVD